MSPLPAKVTKLRCLMGVGIFFVASTFGSVGALADSEAFPDPNDSVGRLDVKALRHNHTLDGTLKHTIITRDGWTKRAFARRGTIFAYFSYYGDSCADARVWIDTKNGQLRARWQSYNPLGCPKDDDHGGSSDSYTDLTVKKPAPMGPGPATPSTTAAISPVRR